MAKYAGPSVEDDLARLDKDPDTRRSAMDALKGCVEHLDVKTMPEFLDQVSEARENEASRAYAVSLYEDVARVHKAAVLPFVPRIMSTVVRSLASGGGSPQLQQACAKVVASIARYAIDPARPCSRNEGKLAELCHPLLAVLSSKVEPLAGGAAMCLQAVVESEKWKCAPPDLVGDICSKTSAALSEKATQSVAHMQLGRSLIKFNTDAMQNYGAWLLRSATEILKAAGGTGGSWQNRVSSAQLLCSVLKVTEKETLSSELGLAIEALESSRLDRMPVVRSAVSDALNAAKSLTSEKDSTQTNGGEPSPGNLSVLDSGKRARRRRLWKADEELSPPLRQRLSGSQESEVASYVSSPAASASSFNSAFVSSSSTGRSGTEMERSPLFPAKEVPLKLNPHFGSSELKENVSGRKVLGIASTISSVGLANGTAIEGSHTPSPGSGANDFMDHRGGTEFISGFSFSGDFLFGRESDNQDVCLNEEEALSFWDGVKETDNSRHHHVNLEIEGATANEGCQQAQETGNADSDQRSQDSLVKACSCNSMQGSLDRKGSLESVSKEDGLESRDNFSEDARGVDNSEHGHGESEKSNEFLDPLLACSSRYNSLAHLVNLEDSVSPQRVKSQMNAADIFLFSTPRKLVHSLQSGCSSPVSGGSSVYCGKEDVDMDVETLSESGWSVRDNPTAGDSEVLQDENVLDCFISHRRLVSDSSVHYSKDDGEASIQAEGNAILCERKMAVTDLSALVPNLQSNVEKSEMRLASNVMVSINCNRHWRTAICKESITKLLPMRFGTSLKIGILRCTLPGMGNLANWLKCVSDRDWSVFLGRLNRVQSVVEMFLGCVLCIILVLPISIAVIRCFSIHQDIHVLVPT